MASLQTDETSDSHSAKAARFEARITAEQKTLFLRAAALTGRSLTVFVVASEVACSISKDRCADWEEVLLSSEVEGLLFTKKNITTITKKIKIKRKRIIRTEKPFFVSGT